MRQLILGLKEREENNEKRHAAEIQSVRDQAWVASGSKEIGEVLKPTPPEMYDGNPEGLRAFITKLRQYFKYYPVQFG
jgi:hypothetical protein